MIEVLVVLFFTALMIGFWPSIRTFFATKVIPEVKKILGEKFSNPLVTIVSWLDGKIRGIRRGMCEALKFFKHNVLGVRIEIERSPSNVILVKQEATIANDDGTRTTVEETSEMKFGELKVEWQNKMLSGQKVSEDVKKTMLDEAQKRLESEKTFADEEERIERDKCLAVLEN